MNSKSSPSPIQKALDLAKRRQFDQVKQASAENEYAKLREATDVVNNNNNEKFQHFKRLTKDTKKSAFKSNMVESSKKPIQNSTTIWWRNWPGKSLEQLYVAVEVL